MLWCRELDWLILSFGAFYGKGLLNLVSLSFTVQPKSPATSSSTFRGFYQQKQTPVIFSLFRFCIERSSFLYLPGHNLKISDFTYMGFHSGFKYKRLGSADSSILNSFPINNRTHRTFDWCWSRIHDKFHQPSGSNIFSCTGAKYSVALSIFNLIPLRISASVSEPLSKQSSINDSSFSAAISTSSLCSSSAFSFRIGNIQNFRVSHRLICIYTFSSSSHR